MLLDGNLDVTRNVARHAVASHQVNPCVSKRSYKPKVNRTRPSELKIKIREKVAEIPIGDAAKSYVRIGF